MELKTETYKSMRGGWKSDTSVELGDDRVLIVTTSKGNGGALTTMASVHIRERGFLTHRFSFGGPDGDYSARLEVNKPARVTEGVVREQHMRNLSNIEAVIERALSHLPGPDDPVPGGMYPDDI